MVVAGKHATSHNSPYTRLQLDLKRRHNISAAGSRFLYQAKEPLVIYSMGLKITIEILVPAFSKAHFAA